MPEETFDDWLATRPECVRKLASEFPPGTRIRGTGFNIPDGPGTTHPVEFWVVGYNEDDMVIVSPVDPRKDFDAALAPENKHYICAQHIRDCEIKVG
jgi:hypothetical protein